VVSKSQVAALEVLMFCKHVKQILVGAKVDVPLSLNAEVKQCHNIPISSRIVILHIRNQIYEVGKFSIEDDIDDGWVQKN